MYLTVLQENTDSEYLHIGFTVSFNTDIGTAFIFLEVKYFALISFNRTKSELHSID